MATSEGSRADGTDEASSSTPVGTPVGAPVGAPVSTPVSAPVSAPPRPALVVRVGWSVLGLLFVGLGAVGIVIPGLPTTPFLLLAAACFTRGSAKLESWLLADPLFGPLIKEFRANRVVPLRAKALALTLMWVFVGYALGPGLPDGAVVARIVVGVAALMGTGYLLSLRTSRRAR